MFSKLKMLLINDRGNMAVMAALVMLPILMAVGVALDFSLLAKKKTEVQNQLDTAVLAAIHEENDGNARNVLKDKLTNKLDDFKLENFSYNESTETKTVSAEMTANYQLLFGGLLGKNIAEIKVESTAVSQLDVTELLFRPINAKGQYHKDVYLKILRPSGDVETLGTFVYNPTLPSSFVVSSANWIPLEDYRKIILEMRVHNDIEPNATAKLKDWYGDDQTFAVDEVGFSEHLWVDDVQLKPDEVITNKVLFSCGATRRHNWEDVPRGYPTTDTPDFEFEILARCGVSKNNIRIID